MKWVDQPFRGTGQHVNPISVKEVCTEIAMPTRSAWRKFKRPVQFLVHVEGLLPERAVQIVEDW